MAKKLTLSVDENVIVKAKRYARDHQTSLSSMVEHYFAYLTTDQIEERIPLSPLVSELTGIISLEKGFDLKKEYGDHLEEKYLK